MVVVRNRSPHQQRWSEEEVQILRKYRSSLSSEELTKLLPNRTIKGIENRCQKLGLADPNSWGPKEIRLINAYTKRGWGINTIAHKLKRSRSSVATYKKNHGLTQSRATWTKGEEDIIQQNWQSMSDGDLHKLIPNHTRIAIGAHRVELGLTDSSCKKSQGEKRIRQLLQIIPLPRIENGRHSEIEYLELDIYYPDIKLGIEYNGAQHYRPVCFGGISKELAKENFRRQIIRDMRKKRACKEKGILLVVVPYNVYLSHKNLCKILQKYSNRNGQHQAAQYLQQHVLNSKE
jgi:hypothetical protein